MYGRVFFDESEILGKNLTITSSLLHSCRLPRSIAAVDVLHPLLADASAADAQSNARRHLDQSAA